MNRPTHPHRPLIGAASALALLVACGGEPADLDADLRSALAAQGVEPLDFGETPDTALIELGEALFFDRELSGNRDIACATCHHPAFHSSDGLSVSIGTGGEGLGDTRQLGAGRSFIPRNAPEVFNRGAPAWSSMFWDSRVAGAPYEALESPAGADLPGSLPSSLAAQAMFPPTSGDEMRGRPGDVDVFGQPNELGALADDDLLGIWDALGARLRRFSGYRWLFGAAFPDVPAAEVGFEHAAQAIAAYEVAAFTFDDSPWDRYVAGDDFALTDAEKRGALLFFGDARCSQCHSGALLTDQAHHNICAPQVGPGKGDAAPHDLGRGGVSSDASENYAFRTPPLRNVALTGPWMHDGAYTSLEAAVRHHLDPRGALGAYDRAQLDPRLRSTVVDDAAAISAMVEGADPLVREPIALDDGQIADLLAFLDALTAPDAVDLSYLVPRSVPSGLPVDR